MTKWESGKIIKECKNYRIVYKSVFLIDFWFKYDNLYCVQEKINLKFMFWSWDNWRDIGIPFSKLEKAESLLRTLREEEIRAFK